MRQWIAVAAMAAASVLAPGVSAEGPCAGPSSFGDVASSNGICQSTEWLLNRRITLGCQAGGAPPIYCPASSVTRAAMALFMDRLAQVTTPEVMKDHVTLLNVPLPGEPPTPPLILCDTGSDSTVAAYPRTALLHATVTGLADGNPVAWRAFWLYSLDSGVVFQAIQDGGQNISSPRASSAANQWSGLALAFAIDLPANTPLQVRVGVRRDDILAGTTGSFVNMKCQMTVSIVNAK